MKSLLTIYCCLMFLLLIRFTAEKKETKNGRRSGHKIKNIKWNSRQYTQKGDNDWVQKRIKQITTKNCGLKLATNYIVGGEEAEKNEFPFIVSLQEHGKHFCGGVIINHWWIITAAHCVFGIENETVYPDTIGFMAGAHRYSTGDQFYTINKMFIPDNFQVIVNSTKNSWGFEWADPFKDIALIKSAFKIRFNSAVNAICLPTEQNSDPFGVLTVAGWGNTAYSGDKDNWPENLRKVNLNIVSDQYCANIHAKLDVKIYRSVVCANDQLKDTNSGDSGSPGFQYTNGRAVLVGIVCAGYGPPYPAIFTQVSYYLKWISSKID